MKYLDGTEKTLFGLNIGIIGFGVAAILLVITLYTELKQSKK
ncbi:hypothetical protein [Spongiivirga citrea]|nr:hypothetical protein [Spongiivirga citrea]